MFFFNRRESNDDDFHSNGSWYHELGYSNRILHVQGQQIRIHCHHDHCQSLSRSFQKLPKHSQKQKQNAFLEAF